MIDEVCAYLKNYFDRNQPKYFGKIVISNGALSDFEDKLQTNQYFRIVGSVFNDGVYKYPATGLVDEEFENGAVWAMALPPDFISICFEIQQWQTAYGQADGAMLSPYTSESLSGVSSYSKGAVGSTNSDGTPTGNTWQGAFGARLKRWRKI